MARSQRAASLGKGCTTSDLRWYPSCSGLGQLPPAGLCWGMQGHGSGQGGFRGQLFPLCLRMMADGLVTGERPCSLLPAYPSVSALGQVSCARSHLAPGLKHCGYGQAEIFL